MLRLAPGDDESTRCALEMIYGAGLECIGEGFRVLDIGCGNGAQTLRLAAELGCKVTAVDNHQPYLDELERRAASRSRHDPKRDRCLQTLLALVWLRVLPVANSELMSEQVHFIPENSSPAPQRHRGAGGEDLQSAFDAYFCVIPSSKTGCESNVLHIQ